MSLPVLIAIALLSVGAAEVPNGHGTKPPQRDKSTSEPLALQGFAPLIDSSPQLGTGFVQPVDGWYIDRACNSYDRQRCSSACGGSRTSTCLGVEGGVRYCSACISLNQLVENVCNEEEIRQ